MHDPRNIFLNHRLEQRYAMKAQSIPVLRLLVLTNSLPGNVYFMSQLVKANRPDILRLVYPTTRQNFTVRLSPIHDVATLLTRIILWVGLLGPIPIECESVLGSSTGTAV